MKEEPFNWNLLVEDWNQTIVFNINPDKQRHREMDFIFYKLQAHHPLFKGKELKDVLLEEATALGMRALEEVQKVKYERLGITCLPVIVSEEDKEVLERVIRDAYRVSNGDE